MKPLLAQSSPARPGSEPGGDDIEGLIVLAPDPGIWPLVLWGTLFLVLLLALGVGAWWLVRHFSRNSHRLPPETKALRTIRRLESNAATLAPHDLSLETSEALKDFLRERYADPLRYESAEEFLARMATTEGASRMTPALHEDLRSFVLMSEELKFGRPRNAQKRVGPLLQLAYNIVNLSRTVSASPTPRK